VGVGCRRGPAAGRDGDLSGHPSWRSIVGFYLKGLVIAAIAGLAVALADETATGLLVALAIAALTILAGFVKRIATVYTITDRRLNIRRGVVARKVQETRLQRVQNVNFNQSVYQRLMQISDVDFDTAAGDDYNFVFGRSRPARGGRGTGGSGDPRRERRSLARRPRARLRLRPVRRPLRAARSRRRRADRRAGRCAPR